LFERYTEHARRSIFFARYEASMFGSPQITSGELLLGILRGHNALAMRIGSGVVESIRNELQPLSSPKQKVSTSVDLPLSNESKRALTYGAEEADALGHKQIDAPHLLLGLMRLEESVAAQLLSKHGIKYAEFRKIVAEERLAERKPDRPAAWQEPPVVAPLAKMLEPAISRLRQLVDNTSVRLREYSDAYGDQPLKRKPWTRKEALGNLIDWAMLHQQWVIRAMMESKLKAWISQ
jgi:ATP-dependent Clp protease ATP-binding subunit ClpC